jgi:hypothetical protein
VTSTRFDAAKQLETLRIQVNRATPDESLGLTDLFPDLVDRADEQGTAVEAL